MNRFWAVVALFCMVGASFAEEVSSEVSQMQAEVTRRGDMVEYTADGNICYGTGADALYAEAVEPPESDADKWFVSVVTTANCKGCVKLKAAWRRNPWLLAIANPADAESSWAHYREYSTSDRSQRWRFAKLNIKTYPTVIVQPPRSKKYGDPTTVVFQGVYQSKPKELASRITGAIKQYIQKLPKAEAAASRGGRRELPLQGDSEDGAAAPTRSRSYRDRAPPWEPPPKEDGLLPFLDQPNPADIVIPPVDVLSVPFPWWAILGLLTTGFSIPAIIALAIWGLCLIRNRRKAAGKEPLVSDETFSQAVDTLKSIADRLDAALEPKQSTRAKPKRKKATARR